jgi:hypothetical protein
VKYNKPKLTKVQKLMKSFREERKKTPYKRKNTITPGPWTNLPTKLKLTPTLRTNHSVGGLEFYGLYRDTSNWNERAWYPISINIELPDLLPLVQKHGLDQIMAACEQSLNARVDGRKRYGTIILLSVFSDNSQNPDPTRRFLSCLAKTNKKRVPGFIATRKGELVVYSKAEEEPSKADIL